MFIAVTDVPEIKGEYKRASVRQVCLMMVSDRLIPLDSANEAVIEEKLCRERRSFLKPLIYDSDLAEYHPNFCLTDTPSGDIYPMEVWGLDQVGYLLHRQEKTVWYNTHYPQSWWGWDAAGDPQRKKITDFPCRAASYAEKYPWPVEEN
ncbi:DUF1173 family protein [Pantoea sp. BAV 3049]|uniref:DUF1173 family protein n=1 Tax=Pantoea sp. BAV 3049 TaxID=2654188 RepID=UPI00131AC1DB|nr:DUF1173 family protein [Pantoea sp. BAV 3049]